MGCIAQKVRARVKHVVVKGVVGVGNIIGFLLDGGVRKVQQIGPTSTLNGVLCNGMRVSGCGTACKNEAQSSGDQRWGWRLHSVIMVGPLVGC